jgi:glycosyltransferase involved in cell wall biosynthesis
VTVVDLDFATPGGIVAGLYRLAKLIADVRPEIVQGWMYHGDLAALVALVLSGRRRQTHLIWSIRCSDMDFARYRVQLRMVVRACAALSGRPDMVTANSAAGLAVHLRLGYRPRRTEVVYNGIDIDRFRPDAAARMAVRSELGIAADVILLAHVARVDPMKDHESFLAAMAQLPDLHALLIGTGTESLPVAANILRLGRRSDVARLLAAADIVVSSSAFGEGFSNALAEGMSCGLPAVATDVGDAGAIVGDTGLIVPKRDPQALAARSCETCPGTGDGPALSVASGRARASRRISAWRERSRALRSFTRRWASRPIRWASILPSNQVRRPITSSNRSIQRWATRLISYGRTASRAERARKAQRSATAVSATRRELRRRQSFK